MRPRIAFTASLIVAVTFTITAQPPHNTAPKANSKREELPEGTEAANAIHAPR